MPGEAPGRGRTVPAVLVGLSLLCAPAALLLAEVLHPRARGGVAEQLEAAGVHSGRWLAADVAGLVALMLAPFFVFTLFRLAGGARSRLALTGAALALATVPLAAGRVTIDLAIWSLANRRADPVVHPLARDLQDSWPFFVAFTLLPLLLVAGVGALALALALHVAPAARPGAILILLGVLLVGVVGPLVQVATTNLVEIVGAALLLVGAGHVCPPLRLSLLRRPPGPRGRRAGTSGNVG